MNKNGIIYKATNLINGKCYIGKTEREFKKRMCEHMNPSSAPDKEVYFHRAIKKYGKQNFTWEVIYECDDPLILGIMETMKIIVNHSHHTEGKGYNLTWGGDGHITGYKLTDKTKRRISKANTGKKRTEKSKERYSKSKTLYWENQNKRDEQSNRFMGENNPMFGKEGYWKGKKIPEDTKKKISKTLTGRPLPDDVKEKISNSLKGREFSLETREKLRIINMGENNPMFGKTPWNKGKKQPPTSDEIKEKLGKKWKITYPDGSMIMLSNLKKWCSENNMVYYKFLRYRGYNEYILQEVI